MSNCFALKVVYQYLVLLWKCKVTIITNPGKIQNFNPKLLKKMVSKVKKKTYMQIEDPK